MEGTKGFCCHCPVRRRWDPSSRPKDKSTPLPKLKVFAAVSAVFTSQLGAMLVFPFLAFMVHDFFPELHFEEIGRKAGFLGSAYYIGNFFGSLFWGSLSDVWGRRPVLLLGIFGAFCSDLLFGFSQNFAWAVTARFLRGLLEGNLAVGKPYISEVCDDSNQAKAFSFLSVGAAFGRIFGSIVGGFLAQPASKYGPLQTPFFCQFPYLLPCLALAFMDVMAFLACFLFLTESERARRRESEDRGMLDQTSDSGIEMSRPMSEEEEEDEEEEGERTALMSEYGEEGEGERKDETTGERNQLNRDLDCQIPLIVESDMDSESDPEAVASDTELLINERRRERRSDSWVKFRNPQDYFNDTRARVAGCHAGCVACAVACHSFSWKQQVTREKVKEYAHRKARTGLSRTKQVLLLLLDRRVFFSITIYGLFGFLTLIGQEVFPLLMVTDTAHGGYKFDDNEIGLILSLSSIIQLSYMVILYPRVVKLLGLRRLLQISILGVAIATVLVPLSNTITGPISGGVNNTTNTSQAMNGSFYASELTGFSNSSLFPDDSGDYCGNGTFDESGVNENSIRRVPVHVWAFLIFNAAFLFLSRTNGYACIFVLINNSSRPGNGGLVNGIAQMYVAFGRVLGPLLGSLLFAWSEATGRGWPLNYHLVFDLVGVGCVLLMLLVFVLPKSSEKKRLEVETG